MRESLVERPEGNIKMDLKETGSECLHWIQLAQDVVQWRALVNAAVKQLN
jgi:hypothetical protein